MAPESGRRGPQGVRAGRRAPQGARVRQESLLGRQSRQKSPLKVLELQRSLPRCEKSIVLVQEEHGTTYDPY